jgi:hypothetical protein
MPAQKGSQRAASSTTYSTRRLYHQIDRENIRNRRQHEIEYIQRRIGILDFVLSNLQYRYLETEPEKMSLALIS